MRSLYVQHVPSGKVNCQSVIF
uniref:Uncharacterized protein n=1 Tax=Anguilla anguilla TaxID=7936 RepID=A0A0E9R952_ANGAN